MDNSASQKSAPESSLIFIPVSVGELIDKITILEIKMMMISHAEQLENIKKELNMLHSIAHERVIWSKEFHDLKEELSLVNKELWDIEDDIRSCERSKDFSINFIELARNVYIKNDKRAAIKRQINMISGSELVEEKSYKQYN